MQETLDRILKEKIVAIVRGIPSGKIVPLVEALVAGGIHCVEVTFDQSDPEREADTLASIRRIGEHFGDAVCVGAGTVMTADQVRRAAEAGAAYMISPNMDEAVIRETKRLGLVSIPGAMTPSEIAQAYALGADIVKLFPGSVLGPGFVKAVKAPLKHIPVMVVGGVNLENCAAFLRAGAAGVGVGGNLVSEQLLDAGKTEEITSLAQDYVRALAEN